uniref:Succinate dehydrogenase assembly factor 2, mitochondrial n=1 Tax=Schistosoma japonicum TaxID=6182 RepID=Q5DCQ3_SCHJA|nr:SJCHGC09209 protein [Schistosoma japonicum]
MNNKWHNIARLINKLDGRVVAIPKCPAKTFLGYPLFSSKSSFDQNNDLESIQLRSRNQILNTETDDIRRARLLYQSRKRGNLENGILLSTFAAQYLNTMTHEQLIAYDDLINLPDNEWDLYYWITKAKQAPEYFQTDVLQLLQRTLSK